jgi:hypothetical protein
MAKAVCSRSTPEWCSLAEALAEAVKLFRKPNAAENFVRNKLRTREWRWRHIDSDGNWRNDNDISPNLFADLDPSHLRVIWAESWAYGWCYVDSDMPPNLSAEVDHELKIQIPPIQLSGDYRHLRAWLVAAKPPPRRRLEVPASSFWAPNWVREWTVDGSLYRLDSSGRMERRVEFYNIQVQAKWPSEPTPVLLSARRGSNIRIIFPALRVSRERLRCR